MSTGVNTIARPIRFGGDRLVPTRDWANAWPAAFTRYFNRLLEAYRDRVRSYWAQQYRDHPQAFLLASPLEVLAIASLGAYWIFIQRAHTDSIRVIPAWEHESLDDWDFVQAPEEHRERVVRQLFLDGTSWELLEQLPVTGAIIITDGVPQFYYPEDRGKNFADADASNLKLQLALQRQPIDHAALERVREDLTRLAEFSNHQRRGREFELVVRALLHAHGCLVEQGHLGKAEQIDVFMTHPQYALIECRWQKAPLQAGAIRDLVAKLTTRHSKVDGLYFSMSGFAEGAATTVRDSHARAIVLVGPSDISVLASGEILFQDFWRARVSQLIRRYPE